MFISLVWKSGVARLSKVWIRPPQYHMQKVHCTNSVVIHIFIAGYSVLVGADAWGFCVSSCGVWSLYW